MSDAAGMIWLVSDHHGTRQSLPGLLAAKAYKVAELDCGDEVLKRVRFQTPALIIIDCGFRDAFGTLAKLRAQEPSRPIPVVMFSIDDQNQRERALLAGADAYVPKGSLDWAELLLEVVRFAGSPSNDRPE